jgi:hypothetical protein
VSSGRDADHKLRVNGGEYEVVHTADCPTERFPTLLGGLPDQTEYVCDVGRHVAMWGFDDLCSENGTELAALHLPDGDHPLVLDWYTPDSMFEDSEVTFYVASPKEPVSEERPFAEDWGDA